MFKDTWRHEPIGYALFLFVKSIQKYEISELHMPEKIPILHNLEFWSIFAFRILKRSMMGVS